MQREKRGFFTGPEIVNGQDLSNKQVMQKNHRCGQTCYFSKLFASGASQQQWAATAGGRQAAGVFLKKLQKAGIHSLAPNFDQERSKIDRYWPR